MGDYLSAAECRSYGHKCLTNYKAVHAVININNLEAVIVKVLLHVGIIAGRHASVQA